LFEGESDHRLPSCDARILRIGIFKVVCRFMGHVAIHSGIGFLGLSEGVAEYLLTDTVDSDTPVTLHVDDLPDFELRECLKLVSYLSVISSIRYYLIKIRKKLLIIISFT